MEGAKRSAVERKVVRSTFFEVDIRDPDSKRRMCFIDKVHPTVTVGELKALFNKTHPAMYPARICFKVDPRGRAIRDEEVLKNLPVATTAVLFMFDLGPQVDKTTAFLVKYTCMFIVYLLFYLRVYPVYTEDDVCSFSPHRVVHLACICHSFHYIKCLLEAAFVHKISRGTMPLTSMVIDCTCHAIFTAWMGYYINHPLYTPPSYRLTALGMMCFTVCQLGSYFIHISLRDLHTPGRSRLPYPSPGMNPFTWPFALVSCPNYTYEARLPTPDLDP
ncbi:very-long-chain enoyl-CoA reductase-like [Petromyzon marinus]|uniref:very-long-chain enoyl-CoA reductase-like n=1 Tax=Petromyzon marinus TaxID=7757 RepID=UPI003F72D62B